MFKIMTLIISLGMSSVTYAQAEKSSEWQPLFDGKSMAGWKGYKTETIGKEWQVHNGEMMLTGKGGGNILTVDQYKNFELTLDWKISKGGNSGVFYHIEEGVESVPYWTGPEMQILDNSRGEPPLERAGSLFALYPVEDSHTKPVGEFNQARLKVQDGKVEHWLNGHMVASYDLNSDDFKARIANSKFSSHPRFAKVGTGHIGIQDHGDPVSFKNIMIRKLD